VSGRAALAFTVANFAGAALNYLFQVHAAAVLDAPSFGLLSAWLARVTVIGAVATLIQFVSLEYRLSDARFGALLRATGILSVAIVGVHLVAGTRAPLLVLGAAAVIGGILLYAVVGQLQARLHLGVIAVSLLASSALRFALPFAWARDVRAPAFYVAHSAASFAGVAAVAMVVALRPARAAAMAAPDGPTVERRLRLGRPALLAFATVLFPLLDVLVVSSTQDAATTGAFSRVALAARIVFFAGAAALQILLPHQMHAASTGEPLPGFALRIERWLTSVVLAGALMLAALLDRVVMHTEGEERTWLFASCLAAALLVSILGYVNRFAAEGRLRTAAACVAGVVVSSGAAAALAALSGANAPVTRYVAAALLGDAVVLLVARAAQNRARAGGGLR
jgi:hypothetical protein